MGRQKQKSKEADQQMNEEFNLLKVVAEQNHERILAYEVDTDIVRMYSVVNGAFEIIHEVQQYLKGDNIGKYFIEPEDTEIYRKAINACLLRPCQQRIEVHYRDKGQQPEWYSAYLVSTAGEDGNVAKIIGRLMSVQEDKLANEQIRRRAEIDALTNVYNHKAFEETCEKELTEGKENAIFLMMDVDDFKMINDTQGHNVGDLVLSQTGAILNEAVKGRGIAGRLGGDEFAAFVWNFADIQEMHQFCANLRDNLKTIIFDMEYSASIGVGILDNDRMLTFRDLYFEADQAVYAAKHHGKNQIIFYEEIEQKDADEQIEEIEDPGEMAQDADERAILTQLKECLDYFGIESFYDAMVHVRQAICVFYDADVVTLVQQDANGKFSCLEYHKESADMMAKLIASEVEENSAAPFYQLMGDKEEIYVHNIKSIKESNPDLYAHFADKRIWSVMMTKLVEDHQLVGMLQVVNPRKHIEDSALIHMIGEYLSVRIMRQTMSESREYEETHDLLTGLWNRSAYERWHRECDDRSFESAGIFTTDIISLVEINKHFGYHAGNKRLREVAGVLKTVFEGYPIFRYDEDEMLVCCPNITKHEMEVMAKCVQEKLEELTFAVALGYSWRVNIDWKNQITEAEVVMDNDKLKLLHGSSVMNRMEQGVLDELLQLIQDGKFLVYLQPKVDIETGKTQGAEALIRQMDDVLGIVGPGYFIPVLERYKMVHLIDLFVLEEVFKFQKEQLDRGRRLVPIAVNFSKVTILYPDLIEKVSAMTEKYPIPEHMIHIEVTETVGDMDHVVIEKVANSLKTLGFCLSMDDFGTHYSNLAVLIQYDFDSAKIDRSMVKEITTNKKSRKVLDYMTALINDLGINCIVEGIETKEQVDILKETKADMIQGFFFGKPIPKEEFYEEFMKEEN